MPELLPDRIQSTSSSLNWLQTVVFLSRWDLNLISSDFRYSYYKLYFFLCNLQTFKYLAFPHAQMLSFPSKGITLSEKLKH